MEDDELTRLIEAGLPVNSEFGIKPGVKDFKRSRLLIRRIPGEWVNSEAAHRAPDSSYNKTHLYIYIFREKEQFVNTKTKYDTWISTVTKADSNNMTIHWSAATNSFLTNGLISNTTELIRVMANEWSMLLACSLRSVTEDTKVPSA